MNGKTVHGALFVATSRGNLAGMRSLILISASLLAFSAPAVAEVAPAQPSAEAPAVPDAEAAPPADAAPVKSLKPAEIRAEQLDILFARLYTSKGEGTDGLQQKIYALWSANDSPTAEVLLGQAERAMNDGAPAEALSILDRVIGAAPDYAEAWNKRATLYYLMKKDDASLKDIDKVLELEPRHFGALAGRGLILQRQKKYAEALDAFREALRLNPGLETVKDSIKELERIERGI